MRETLQKLFADNGGVVRRRDHPALTHQLDRARARDEVALLLPGVFVPTKARADWQTRLRAGLCWLGPDAVVTRYPAARMTFWPECSNTELSYAVNHQVHPQPGWSVTQANVPPELIWRLGQLQVTCPAYTAVDLAADMGGDVLDRALRSRQATLPQMWQALDAMVGRRGNVERRRLLRDSRDEPWSELERLGHRLLRKERLAGWRSNAWVSTRDGGYYADVLFGASRVIVEFDGFAFHSSPDQFEHDRRRRNELVVAGYTVLNFTWAQVCDDPEWVIGCIRRALKIA